MDASTVLKSGRSSCLVREERLDPQFSISSWKSSTSYFLKSLQVIWSLCYSLWKKCNNWFIHPVSLKSKGKCVEWSLLSSNIIVEHKTFKLYQMDRQRSSLHGHVWICEWKIFLWNLVHSIHLSYLYIQHSLISLYIGSGHAAGQSIRPPDSMKFVTSKPFIFFTIVGEKKVCDSVWFQELFSQILEMWLM